MPRTCRLLPAAIALLLTTAGAVAATAESLTTDAPRYFQIRTTDRRIAGAVDLGLRESQTFRDLAARVNASDVIVYVEADCVMPSGLDGRLTFLSATGGYRYVVVKVNAALSLPRLASLLGHELQHAREIADSDAIVDAATLSQAYAHGIGYRNRVTGWSGPAYDSEAAIRAGEEVLREVLAGE